MLRDTFEQGVHTPRIGGIEEAPGLQAPAASFFDRITRLDDLMLQLMEVIRSTNKTMQIIVPASKREDPQRYAASLVEGTHRTSWVKTYPMDIAMTDKEILVDGDFIHVWTDGTLDGVTFKPNKMDLDNNTFYFKRRNPMILEFQKFYLTFPAQAGKTLDIMVGREAATTAQSTEVSVTSSQYFYTLISDKDSHFAGALAQFVKEDENLTGLLSDKIKITGVTVQCKEQLHYKLLLWYKDTFENADLDVDEFCGEIDVDLPAYGVRIGGANQWYLDIRGLNVDYIDLDSTGELHISLINMSVAAKQAAAAGEIQVTVTYEPRS